MGSADIAFINTCKDILENGKYGYINKIGQEIVPFKYIDAQDFQYGMAWVKIKNIFGRNWTKCK